ncbi:hypothetical protein EPN81_03165 [Patescibacteria group bacterium]|nr:MAG: hypothetical protein EPN81_03165 [Patescibacteria group bacterium]
MSGTMDELKKELEHLGMTDKESRVYLAALEMGPSPVQDISHKAKVNRATTYVMIESLSARGLMSTFQKGKKRFYAAESPDRLLTIVEREQKILSEKQAEIMKALPMLETLYNAEGAKPQVRYLEGIEGLETTRATFERLSGEAIQIVPVDDVLAMEEGLHGRNVHLERLAKRGIKGRVLGVMKQLDRSKLPSIENVEVRLITHDSFPIHGEVGVRGNHVFLYSHKSSVLSLVIVSQEIADVIRALFDMAWAGVASNK